MAMWDRACQVSWLVPVSAVYDSVWVGGDFCGALQEGGWHGGCCGGLRGCQGWLGLGDALGCRAVCSLQGEEDVVPHVVWVDCVGVVGRAEARVGLVSGS